jgi:hypothetical protein
MDLWRSAMCLLFRRVYIKTSYAHHDHVLPVRWHDGGLWFWFYSQEYRLREDGTAVALGGATQRWQRYAPPMVSAKPLHFDLPRIRS